MPVASNIPVMCYDFVAVIRFFRSVALAVATQKTTQIEWQTYRDSSVLNAVYTVMFWKEPPGFAEVRTGTRRQIESMTDELQLHYVQVWLEKLHNGGPNASNIYVTQMENVRNSARDAVTSLFREARIVNDMVINQTTEAIHDLAKVKLAAQVGVAVIGAVTGIGFVAAAAGGTAAGGATTIIGIKAGAGALAFAGVGLGHSVSHSLIKSWEQGPGAKVAGIVWETGKAGVSEGLGGKAGGALDNALKGTAQTEANLAKLGKDINRHSAALARKSVRGASRTAAAEALVRKQGMQAVERETAKNYARTGAQAARFGMTVPVVFAAWDIYDAFGDYTETVSGL